MGNSVRVRALSRLTSSIRAHQFSRTKEGRVGILVSVSGDGLIELTDVKDAWSSVSRPFVSDMCIIP